MSRERVCAWARSLLLLGGVFAALMVVLPLALDPAGGYAQDRRDPRARTTGRGEEARRRGFEIEPDGARTGAWRFALNALDYRHQLIDLSMRRLGTSVQIDKDLREYSGDLYFTGKALSIVEDFERGGLLLDLGPGRSTGAGDLTRYGEFSLFYGLRLFKRHFQVREFPYLDRFVPYAGIDRDILFARPTDESPREVAVRIGHTYLVRIASRTRVEPGRVYLLRVLEYVPGVKVEALVRQLDAQ